MQDKLFESNHPLITPGRWLKDFAAPNMKSDVIPKVLKDNAVLALGLPSS
jgi:uncharacterized protein